MTDLESEEIFEGPKVSSALEFGGTTDRPRTRDKWWFRAMTSESGPGEGLIMKIARRPRHHRGDDPHPTVRLMQENPNGILYAKVKAGEIRVENYYDFMNRMALQTRDEEEKEEKKKKKKT